MLVAGVVQRLRHDAAKPSQADQAGRRSQVQPAIGRPADRYQLGNLLVVARRQFALEGGPPLPGDIGQIPGGLASADFKPTGQQLEVQKGLEEQLRNVLSQLDTAFSRELGSLNGLLRKKNISNIVVKPE